MGRGGGQISRSQEVPSPGQQEGTDPATAKQEGTAPWGLLPAPSSTSFSPKPTLHLWT